MKHAPHHGELAGRRHVAHPVGGGRKEAALHATGHALAQDPSGPSGTYTDTSSESWFSRMGDAFMAVIVGLVLVTIAVPVLWFNERRVARMESIIAVGEGECVSVKRANAENRGDLVHVSGGEVRATKAVTDPTFQGLSFDTKCVRLQTTIEVFQWKEHEKKEEKKNLVGGGTTTITTYQYTKGMVEC